MTEEGELEEPTALPDDVPVSDPDGDDIAEPTEDDPEAEHISPLREDRT